MKAVTGVWSAIGVSDLNRILKPHGVRLIKTTKKAWGEAVSITAHPIEAPVVISGDPGALAVRLPGDLPPGDGDQH